jgi:hypothetical protein
MSHPMAVDCELETKRAAITSAVLNNQLKQSECHLTETMATSSAAIALSRQTLARLVARDLR